MKKKQLRKLISLFEFLPLAGAILSGKTVPEAEASQINEALKSLRIMRNDTANTFIVKVFDEINHNLYHLPDSRMEYYLEDILRGFAGISPFLCYPFGIPGSEIFNDSPDAPQNDFPDECLASLRLLSSLEEDTDIDDDSLSDAAKYLFSCYALLLFFSRTFDSRCLHFKLNLDEIQHRLGIYIPCDRNYNELINAGYWDKVLEMVSEDETPPKALPENTDREEPKIKPFTEWLNHKMPEKLASICKYVFDAKHRQKDYAIMLCLLHQYRYINLNKKNRRHFYDSWFQFIGKPFPKNHNYYAINKHIDPYEGFQMIDDDSSHYHNIQGLFDWKLKVTRGM